MDGEIRTLLELHKQSNIRTEEEKKRSTHPRSEIIDQTRGAFDQTTM